jgi:hypothetical protein
MWLVCRFVELSRLGSRYCVASVLHGTPDSGYIHYGEPRLYREKIGTSSLATWLCCLTVLFANKFLPRIESTGAFFIVGGFLVSVIVCAVMPYVNGRPYTTNAFVWRNWTNGTGWKNNGFVFCQGMLNAAFAVCAPDIPSHMAEEIPRVGSCLTQDITQQILIHRQRLRRFADQASMSPRRSWLNMSPPSSRVSATSSQSSTPSRTSTPFSPPTQSFYSP